MNKKLFPVGTKVFIDGRYPATVVQAFPEGSTSYAFPHYEVREGKHLAAIVVAMDRITGQMNTTNTKKTITLKLTETQALKLGVVFCECGHPPNNHFDHNDKPCAHCSCKVYRQVIRVCGETIEAT